MCWAATARRKPFPCRLALGSCAALLFLGGCAGTGPLSDDGGSVLSKALEARQEIFQSIQQLDWESLEQYTEVETLLREAAGQDLYLKIWQLDCESLDQCAMFLEETGYGGLEQPLEQVHEYRRTYLDGRCYEVFVQDSMLEMEIEAEEVLLLDLPDGTRQEVHIQPKTHRAVTWELRQEDLNFDGYPDLAINIGGVIGSFRFADALLWDETVQEYREEPSFTQISSPVLDPEHSIIWGGYEANWEKYRGAYEFREGVFIQIHALSAMPNESANWVFGSYCIEYARTDDGWSEVNRLEFPFEENYKSTLECYLEAGPVWSGWLWMDMDWHTVHGA